MQGVFGAVQGRDKMIMLYRTQRGYVPDSPIVESERNIVQVCDVNWYAVSGERQRGRR